MGRCHWWIWWYRSRSMQAARKNGIQYLYGCKKWEKDAGETWGGESLRWWKRILILMQICNCRFCEHDHHWAISWTCRTDERSWHSYGLLKRWICHGGSIKFDHRLAVSRPSHSFSLAPYLPYKGFAQVTSQPSGKKCHRSYIKYRWYCAPTWLPLLLFLQGIPVVLRSSFALRGEG